MKEFLTNKDLFDIWDSYDAFYFENKYGEASTHKEQFDRLENLVGSVDICGKALAWMKDCYDSYYKLEYDDLNDSNPFYYIQERINKYGLGDTK